MPKEPYVPAAQRYKHTNRSHRMAAEYRAQGNCEGGHASAPALDASVKAYEVSRHTHDKSEKDAKLSTSELQSALRQLSGWKVSNKKLRRIYKFADFIHAFGFMATSAIAIQAMGHHPEWFNVYNTVTVDLTTHDAGGISGKDLELARKLDAFAAKLM